MGVPGAPPAPYLGVHAQEGVRAPAAQRRALERLAVVEVVVVLQAPDLEEICFTRGGGHKADTFSSQIREAPRSPDNFLSLFWGQRAPNFAGKCGTTLWAQGWGDPKAGTCRAVPGACSAVGFPSIPWGLEIGAKSKKINKKIPPCSKEQLQNNPAAGSQGVVTTPLASHLRPQEPPRAGAGHRRDRGELSSRPRVPKSQAEPGRQGLLPRSAPFTAPLCSPTPCTREGAGGVSKLPRFWGNSDAPVPLLLFPHSRGIYQRKI